MTGGQAEAHWVVYGDAHRPVAGPLYGDYQCPVCDGPVVEPRRGFIERWRRRRRRCTTCGRRWSEPPCSRNSLTGKGGHTYGGGCAAA